MRSSISHHFTHCKRTHPDKGEETMEISNFVARLLVAFLAGNAKDG